MSTPNKTEQLPCVLMARLRGEVVWRVDCYDGDVELYNELAPSLGPEALREVFGAAMYERAWTRDDHRAWIAGEDYQIGFRFATPYDWDPWAFHFDPLAVANRTRFS
jgi:hypothetical protein